MSSPWFLLDSGFGAPADNMALDEALLDAAAALAQPVLRFYGWTEPAATFGYFQAYLQVAAWTPLRPLIRRPTGGGLVPHGNDWTYSLTFPPGHPWFQLKAARSYQQVHEWIQRAFACLGVPTQLAPARQQATPGQCFAGAECFDLLNGGVKLAGAAQRRNRRGLLIQGSIQPRGSICSRDAWEHAMQQSALFPEPVKWTSLVLDVEHKERSAQLAAGKYSQPWYNQKR
jgi:lipoate-protein ligase A